MDIMFLPAASNGSPMDNSTVLIGLQTGHPLEVLGTILVFWDNSLDMT